MASRLMHCRMNRLWEPRLLLYWSLRRESSLLDGQMTIWLLASKGYGTQGYAGAAGQGSLRGVKVFPCFSL